MNLYAFHLGQIISTVLGRVDRNRILDETFETDYAQKKRFRHGAICQTIKALAILRCLYGSEMVLLGVVIGKCEILPLIFHKKLVMIYSWLIVNLWLKQQLQLQLL